jgi:hypothetical protein
MAATASEQIMQIERYKSQSAGSQSQHGNNANGDNGTSATTVSVNADTPSPDSSSPRSGPLSFMRGTLVGMDCSAKPGAVATVVSGGKTWKLQAADTSRVETRTSQGFCALTNKRVVIFYHKTAADGGDLIGLDVEGDSK